MDAFSSRYGTFHLYHSRDLGLQAEPQPPLLYRGWRLLRARPRKQDSK